MTRIIAGRLAGRRLTVPASGARPTTDRVREAVFSTVTHLLDDWSRCRVLDLFAGSGGLGLEALSRGAASATFVERDRRALAALRANVRALDVAGQCEIEAADVLRWTPRSGRMYDLLLADPPYPMDAPSIAAALLRLRDAGIFAEGAVLLVERPARDGNPPWPSHWTTEQRRYGETSIWYGRAHSDGAHLEGT